MLFIEVILDKILKTNHERILEFLKEVKEQKVKITDLRQLSE